MIFFLLMLFCAIVFIDWTCFSGERYVQWVFFCLFEGFHPTRDTHLETSILPVKGKFDLCSHLWPVNSKGSFFLACHTYCDTGHPFMTVIPEDP